jgi:hypothetical protein
MRFLRHLVATLCLAALGLSAAPAHALGTLTFSPPTWKYADGRSRPPKRLINVLNRQDCLEDAIASFSYSVKGTTGGVFEVWSGAGCDKVENRAASSVSKTCARVATGSTVETRIDLHFREMVKTYGETSDVGIAGCDTPQGAGLQTRALFFVVYDLNSNASLVTSTPVSWQFKYDIVAPPAPTNVSATPGDMTLVTTFTPPTGETNLLHYHFYCSPQGSAPVTSTDGTAGTGATAGTDTGTAGTETTTGGAGTDTAAGGATDAAAGAGTSGTSTGGTSTSVTSDPFCTSTILVPGQPVPDDAIDCGTIGALTSKGGETDPVLENEGQYAIAIATEDDANNIGVLSGLGCGTPRDVSGFYEAYRKAGGQAGGGYCSFAPAHGDALYTGAALLLAACAFWRRRK